MAFVSYYFRHSAHTHTDSSGPGALQATLAMFDDEEEIPVVSRVLQFQSRESRKRKNKNPDAGDDKEPLQSVPSTPKRGTSTPEPSSKKDHELAKKLLRSERLQGPDETRRYLFEDPILESEVPAFGEEKQQEVSDEADAKACFLGGVEGLFAAGI